MSKFHSHDGWYWVRREDGAVAIYRGKELVNVETASSWASIVASVSAGNELDGRFYVAERFHASTGPVALVCDALRGLEPHQPSCSLPAGHDGPHRWDR